MYQASQQINQKHHKYKLLIKIKWLRSFCGHYLTVENPFTRIHTLYFIIIKYIQQNKHIKLQ